MAIVRCGMGYASDPQTENPGSSETASGGTISREKQAKLWHDYGPTLAAEELAEHTGPQLAARPCARWLIEAKLWRHQW